MLSSVGTEQLLRERRRVSSVTIPIRVQFIHYQTMYTILTMLVIIELFIFVIIKIHEE